MDQKPKKYGPVRIIAQRIGKSVSHTKKLAACGAFGSKTKVGKRAVVYDLAKVDEFLRKNTVEVKPQVKIVREVLEIHRFGNQVVAFVRPDRCPWAKYT